MADHSQNKHTSQDDDTSFITHEIATILDSDEGEHFKEQVEEQWMLFRSVIKWTILATLAGMASGAITALFLFLLDEGTKTIHGIPYFYLSLPLVLFGSSFLVVTFAPQAEGHGTEKVIEAVQRFGGKISIKSIPVKMAATLLTLIGGGSAGKEGPSISFSGGICSWIGDILGLNPIDRKTIVVCGISAGFSAVFGTPISGAIYAVEVLVLGRILQSSLFPALVAGIIGFSTARFCGCHYMHLPTLHLQVTGFKLLSWALVAGIFIGIVSVIFIETMNFFERLADRIKIWKPLKGLIGGFILLLLVDTLPNGQMFLGLGEDTILSALHGDHMVASAFLLKILFAAITLAVGGSGGILMPIFFVGTTAGVVFAQAFGLDPQLFAAIGMIALLSSASNTPIAASILGVELFGMEAGVCITLAAIVSFIISGHRSVYPTQVLANSKSAYIRVPLMREFRNISTGEITNEPTLLIPLWDRFRKKK